MYDSPPLVAEERPPLCPQAKQVRHKIAQLARGNQADRSYDQRERDSHSPKHPLVNLHVAHIVGVHTQDAGDCAEGQEDDSDDGEHIDG